MNLATALDECMEWGDESMELINTGSDMPFSPGMEGFAGLSCDHPCISSLRQMHFNEQQV